MAILKKETLIKKKKRQLKKGKMAIPVLQEEENEEEGDHGFKKDKAELDVKEENDEIYDSDECFLNEKLANLQKKVKDIKAKKEEAKIMKEERKKSSNLKKKRKNKQIDGSEAPTKAPKEEIKSKGNKKKSPKSRDARSLYLGKLPNDVTIQDIRGLSQDIVKAHLSKTNGSIRFAFITFKDEETAESYYSVLQKSNIRGQTLNVDYVGNKSSYDVNAKKAEIKEKDSRKLYVGNLPDGVTEEELKRLSKDIFEVFISQGKKNFAFITFKDEATAEYNYSVLQKSNIRGLTLKVDYVGKKSSYNVNAKKAEIKAVKRSQESDLNGTQKSAKKIKR